MEQRRRGRQSFVLTGRPTVCAWASVAGKKEGEGPLAREFDEILTDNRVCAPSWEQAETCIQQRALDRLLQKANCEAGDLDLVFSGDLLNQCIASSFALRGLPVPVLGLYGACSTMAEGILLAASAVEGGWANSASVLTSSHFAASERQYRFPLGYGGQRTPTSQWTVTGCGAVLLKREGRGPKAVSATVGEICDKGITDANNMGAAMAWAAYRTIRAHLDDLSEAPEDYDCILTGDLGHLGKAMVEELFSRDGVRLGDRYADCGAMIFDREKQDVHCGGSGAGCSAAVLCAHFLPRLASGSLRRVLFCGTGALLSPVSVQQKQPIPAVCHAVCLEAP